MLESLVIMREIRGIISIEDYVDFVVVIIVVSYVWQVFSEKDEVLKIFKASSV